MATPKPPTCPCLPVRLALLAGLALLLVSLPAAAGERKTVWAYPPGAGPKGAVESEFWLTTSRKASDSPTGSEYRIEIENGLTDDVSLDVYLGVLKQNPGESLKLDRVQASLRANLVRDPLRIPVDLTGYLEVKRDVDWSSPWAFEAILIGGRNFGRLWYAFNLVYESQLSSKAFDGDIRECKGIVAAGYEFSPRVSFGAEFIAVNNSGTKEYSLGPTLKVGLTEKTWIAIGPQWGLISDADNLKIRAIFGIFF